MTKPFEPRRKWREFPYYKVQFFDPSVQAWKDVQEAFDTVEEAQTYRDEELDGQETRIMVVEGRRERHVMEEEN